MNFRMKSKLKGAWAFVKYKGDAAIYAVCQNCGFTQREVYKDLGNFKMIPAVDKLYKYCPNCGLKMHLYNGENIYKIDRYPWERENA